MNACSIEDFQGSETILHDTTMLNTLVKTHSLYYQEQYLTKDGVDRILGGREGRGGELGQHDGPLDKLRSCEHGRRCWGNRNVILGHRLGSNLWRKKEQLSYYLNFSSPICFRHCQIFYTIYVKWYSVQIFINSHFRIINSTDLRIYNITEMHRVLKRIQMLSQNVDFLIPNHSSLSYTMPPLQAEVRCLIQRLVPPRPCAQQ